MMKELELIAQVQKEAVEREACGAWKFQKTEQEPLFAKRLRKLKSVSRWFKRQPQKKKPLAHL